MTERAALPQGPARIGSSIAALMGSNVIGALGNLGEGSPYRVVVRCVTGGAGNGTGGRQLEVEFSVQFGI